MLSRMKGDILTDFSGDEAHMCVGKFEEDNEEAVLFISFVVTKKEITLQIFLYYNKVVIVHFTRFSLINTRI